MNKKIISSLNIIPKFRKKSKEKEIWDIELKIPYIIIG